MNGRGEVVIASEKLNNPDRIMKTVMDPQTREQTPKGPDRPSPP